MPTGWPRPATWVMFGVLLTDGLLVWIPLATSMRPQTGDAGWTSFAIANGVVFLIGVVAFIAVLMTSWPNLPWRLLVAFPLVILNLIGGFAFTYFELSSYVPESFTGQDSLSSIDAIYVAVTTFTSVGSGSIQPATQTARALITLESITSLIAVALGLGLVIAARRGRS